MKRNLLLILFLVLFVTGCSSNNEVKSNEIRPEDTIFFKENNTINITNEEELNNLSTNCFIAIVNDDGSFTVVSEDNLKDGDNIVIITELDGNYLIDEYVYKNNYDSNNINIGVLMIFIVIVFIIIVEIIILFRQNIYRKKLLNK